MCPSLRRPQYVWVLGRRTACSSEWVPGKFTCVQLRLAHLKPLAAQDDPVCCYSLLLQFIESVGRRRFDDDTWPETIERMNQRLAHGQALYLCQPWPISHFRSQWRYIDHIINGSIPLWSRKICKFNLNLHNDAIAEYLSFRIEDVSHFDGMIISININGSDGRIFITCTALFSVEGYEFQQL